MTAPTLGVRPGASTGVVLAALAQLETDSRPVACVPLPGELLAALTDGGHERLRRLAIVSWEPPGDGAAWFGIGVAAHGGGPRGAGWAGAHEMLDALSAGPAPDTSPARPRVAFGFEFDPACLARDAIWEPFGGWQGILPRLIIVREAGRWHGSFVAVRSGRTDARELAAWLDAQLLRDRERPLRGPVAGCGAPTASQWAATVAVAVDEIAAGRYDKVVLARQHRLRPACTPAEALNRLAANYPNTFVFRFDAGPSVFLGASPERLVSLRGGIVSADSLAGSRPRGDSPAEDDCLAAELLASHKEREEHAFVVDAIRSALAPSCHDLDAPSAPVLMRLANVQHLHTAISGRARPGTTVLDLAERMHPTPAVGGWPCEAALDAIRRLEGMDRGWYAAPIGWAGLDGEGEFAVALRTALIGPHGATLYAGGGIVAESDPQRELAETEWKLRPLREALA